MVEKKQVVLGVRISETLKQRFDKCLDYKGLDQTTFMRTKIVNFVDQVEQEIEERKLYKEYFTKMQQKYKND